MHLLGGASSSQLRLSPFIWAGETDRWGCLVCSGQGTPVTVQVPRWWLAWPGSTVALALLPRCLCSCHLRSLGALKGRVSRFRIIHSVVVYIRSLAPGRVYPVQVMGTCAWPEAFGSAGSVLWMSVFLSPAFSYSRVRTDLLFGASMTSSDGQLRHAVWRKAPPSLPPYGGPRRTLTRCLEVEVPSRLFEKCQLECSDSLGVPRPFSLRVIEVGLGGRRGGTMSKELGLWGPDRGEPQDSEAGVPSLLAVVLVATAHRQEPARSSVCLDPCTGCPEEEDPFQVCD